MRIVVDTAFNTGSAEYSNVGDVAVLRVSLLREQRRKAIALAATEVLLAVSIVRVTTSSKTCTFDAISS